MMRIQQQFTFVSVLRMLFFVRLALPRARRARRAYVRRCQRHGMPIAQTDYVHRNPTELTRASSKFETIRSRPLTGEPPMRRCMRSRHSITVLAVIALTLGASPLHAEFLQQTSCEWRIRRPLL
jgi:hypothetical protein